MKTSDFVISSIKLVVCLVWGRCCNVDDDGDDGCIFGDGNGDVRSIIVDGDLECGSGLDGCDIRSI